MLHSPVDVRQDEADRLDNMIDVFSKTFLGLTVACARCHEHKFDAISQKDYYALAGFLQSSAYRQVSLDAHEQNAKLAAQIHDLRTRYEQRLVSAAAESRREMLDRLDVILLAANQAITTWSKHVGESDIGSAADSPELPLELAAQARAAASRSNLPAKWVESWTHYLLQIRS